MKKVIYHNAKETEDEKFLRLIDKHKQKIKEASL